MAAIDGAILDRKLQAEPMTVPGHHLVWFASTFLAVEVAKAQDFHGGLSPVHDRELPPKSQADSCL